MAAKRKKLVRRQPLTTRLINSPLDYLLSVSESFELVDWDAQAYSIGLPLGAGCCTLLMLCRIYSSLSPTDSSSIEDTLFVTKSAYDKVPKRRPFFTVIVSYWQRIKLYIYKGSLTYFFLVFIIEPDFNNNLCYKFTELSCKEEEVYFNGTFHH